MISGVMRQSHDALIVTAVNAHDALVSACRSAMALCNTLSQKQRTISYSGSRYDNFDVSETLRAAIDLAESSATISPEMENEIMSQHTPEARSIEKVLHDVAMDRHRRHVSGMWEKHEDHPFETCNERLCKESRAALAKSTEQDNGDPSEPGHPDNPRSNYDEVRDRL